MFLNGPTSASFFADFSSFQTTFWKKSVDFSKIQTRIVRVDGKRADQRRQPPQSSR